ncbi:MAG: hypothetical protein L6Q71_04935 [Planctomycetes bacterium]|nr:hypothetical protein [Planctomycetota bacterium]NUQ33491.1 hypothetical protein [Planctomycetaceae bacterium]
MGDDGKRELIEWLLNGIVATRVRTSPARVESVALLIPKDSPARVNIQRLLAHAYYLTAQHGRMTVLVASIDESQPVSNVQRVDNCATRFMACLLGSQFEDALVPLDEGLKWVDDDQTRIHFEHNKALIQRRLGKLPESEALINSVIQECMRLDMRETYARALLTRAELHSEAGNITLALQDAQDVLCAATEVGDAVTAALSHIHLAFFETMANRYDLAESYAQESIRQHQALNMPARAALGMEILVPIQVWRLFETLPSWDTTLDNHQILACEQLGSKLQHLLRNYKSDTRMRLCILNACAAWCEYHAGDRAKALEFARNASLRSSDERPGVTRYFEGYFELARQIIAKLETNT